MKSKFILNIFISVVRFILLGLTIFRSDRANATTDLQNYFTEEPEKSGILEPIVTVTNDRRIANNSESKPIASVAKSDLPIAKPPTDKPRAQATPKSLDNFSKIVVKRIELKCGLEGKNTCIFDRRTPEIAALLQSIEGRTVTVLQVNQLAEHIGKLYNERGYITSGTVIFPQNIDNGVITINTIEGGIERIQIEGLDRVKPEYLKSRIRDAIAKTPINVKDLDERLALLRTQTLFKTIDFQLLPGSRLDRAILKVKVTEAPSIGAYIGFDNFSPLGLGSEKLATAISIRNWSFSGDRLLLSYQLSTTGGSKIYELSYDVPLSSANDVFKVHGLIKDFKVTDPELISFDINGKYNCYELNYRRPIVRSSTEDFAISFGFVYQDNQTLLGQQPAKLDLSSNDNGRIRSSVLRLGQDYTKRDPNGQWVLNSNFNIGTTLFN